MDLRIKEVQKEKKITVVELAGIVGVAQPTMSNLVNGKTTPSLETLQKIADALGVNITELFAPKSDDFTALIDHGGKLYRFDSVETLEAFIAEIKKGETE